MPPNDNDGGGAPCKTRSPKSIAAHRTRTYSQATFRASLRNVASKNQPAFDRFFIA
jgi:hypothetical protein